MPAFLQGTASASIAMYGFLHAPPSRGMTTEKSGGIIAHPALCLAPKILDEGGHIAIARCHAGQPLGVFERGRDIPCVTAEADQREQGFAIAGVACQDVFQNGHGLACPTGRMQPDGIDIGISRPFRLELGGARKLGQRVGRPLEAGERQSERMMQSRIPGRPGDRGAQHALPFGDPGRAAGRDRRD